jgi:hypothetical protein
MEDIERKEQYGSLFSGMNCTWLCPGFNPVISTHISLSTFVRDYMRKFSKWIIACEYGQSGLENNDKNLPELVPKDKLYFDLQLSV